MASQCRRILVVDDSRDYLAFMRSLLTAEGFEVETAQTAAAARSQVCFLRPGPDLIISDVRMPDMPPFAILDLLDGDETTRAIPVLLCTGAVHEVEDASLRLQRRGTEVLFKPFDIDDLFASLDRLCRDRSPV